jgi:hypothetical protein
MAEGQGILDQLLAEAVALGEKKAQKNDVPVRLRAADGSELEGVPLSRLGKDLLAKFGLTVDGEDGKEGGGGGDGDGDQGDKGGTTVRDFFSGGKRAAGGAAGK